MTVTERSFGSGVIETQKPAAFKEWRPPGVDSPRVCLQELASFSSEDFGESIGV